MHEQPPKTAAHDVSQKFDESDYEDLSWIDDWEPTVEALQRMEYERRMREAHANPIDIAKLAEPWMRLGFNVIPGTIAKQPYFKFKKHTGPNGLRVTECDLKEWAIESMRLRTWGEPCTTLLLLLDSGVDFGFVVVDVDDMCQLTWAVKTYGDTPLRVSTGREGGGVHLYYITPSDKPVTQSTGIVGDPAHIDWSYTLDDESKQVQKPKSWGKSGVDIKSRSAYAVVPGSRHMSGKEYKCDVDLTLLTREWIKEHVPEFPHAVHNREKKRAQARRRRKENKIRKEAAKRWPKMHRKSRIKLPAAPQATSVLDGLDPDARSVGKPKGYGCFAECPVFSYAVTYPEQINYSIWFGLASNIAAVYSEHGREMFHQVSSLDQRRYDPDATDKLYSSVLSEPRPMRYDTFAVHGYTGHVPKSPKAPAGLGGGGAYRNRQPPEEPDVQKVLKGASCTTSTGKRLPDIELDMLVDGSTQALILHATMGSGKGYQLKRIFDHEVSGVHQWDRKIVVTPSRALAKEASSRYGLDCYLDVDGNLAGSGVVCINSVRRVSLGERHHHERLVVALDEIEQIADALYGPTIGERTGFVWGDLQRLVAHADLIVVSDAFVSARSIGMLLRLGVDATRIRYHHHEGKYPYRVAMQLDSLAKIYEGAVSMVQHGHKLFVTCSAARDVIALKVFFEALIDKKTGQAKRVLAIYEGGDEAALDSMRTPNTSWVDYDVVVASPKVGSGVDFSVADHFDAVVGIFTSRGAAGMGPWTNMMQQILRIRRAKVLVWYVEDRCACGDPMRDAVALREQRNLQTSRRFQVSWRKSENGVPQPHPANKSHWESYVDTTFLRQVRSYNPMVSIVHHLGDMGVRLMDVSTGDPVVFGEEEKLWRDSVQALKALIDEERAVEKLNSKALQKQVARVLGRHGPTSKTEALQLARRRLLDFFGYLDVELVLDAQKRRAVSKARVLAALCLVHRHGQAAWDRLAELEGKGWTTGFRSTVRHFAAAMEQLLKLLNLAGVPVDELICDLPDVQLQDLTTPLVERVNKTLEQASTPWAVLDIHGRALDLRPESTPSIQSQTVKEGKVDGLQGLRVSPGRTALESGTKDPLYRSDSSAAASTGEKGSGSKGATIQTGAQEKSQSTTVKWEFIARDVKDNEALVAYLTSLSPDQAHLLRSLGVVNLSPKVPDRAIRSALSAMGLKLKQVRKDTEGNRVHCVDEVIRRRSSERATRQLLRIAGNHVPDVQELEAELACKGVTERDPRVVVLVSKGTKLADAILAVRESERSRLLGVPSVKELDDAIDLSWMEGETDSDACGDEEEATQPNLFELLHAKCEDEV